MEARALLPWRALAVLAGAWFLVLLVGTPSQGAETREEAVAAAREGRTGEAITALRKLLAEGTKDPLAIERSFLNAFFHFDEGDHLIDKSLVKHTTRVPAKKMPSSMIPSPGESLAN
jgi:hypothetical protein